MPSEPNLSPQSWQWIRRIGLALLAIGGISRILPLFDQAGRLFRQFPTEDGYLMLTIARNIALGNGPSISDGTILTNGTQPLVTLLWAACFWLADGDRYWGVWLMSVCEIAIAFVAAYALVRLTARVLDPWPHRDSLGIFAAGLWFGSPIVVSHSMNALETGLYLLCVIIVAMMILEMSRRSTQAETQGEPLHAWALLGLALGVTFWVRNDAVLLCLVVGLCHLAGKLLVVSSPFPRRIVEIGLTAVVVTLVAAPWLGFNLASFGHLMPISGQAESMSAAFGSNLTSVPVKLFEYLTFLTPVPQRFEDLPLVPFSCGTLSLLAIAAMLYAARSWTSLQRTLLYVGGGYALALCLFYGLYFGAPHFMSRYLAPFSAFTVIVFSVALLHLLARTGALAAAAGSLVVAGLVLGLNVRLYVLGSQHDHFQVVEWVEQNVEPQTWVGAIQTGTLGFFHDRTVNLDGKVNPEALDARKRGEVPAYVAASEIRYLVDWTGIAGWERKPDLRSTFEVIVNDPERNLAVLRRRKAG